MKKRLSLQTKLLITDSVFMKICDIFFDIFLMAYFYKISDQNIFVLALYNIIGWISAMIGAILISQVLKRYSKIWFYRLGIVIKLSVMLFVALLGPETLNYFWLIAILWGVEIAFNGYIRNFLESENIPSDELIRYSGFGHVFTNSAAILVPVILGGAIFASSFEVTAFTLLVIIALELAISFKIKSRKVERKAGRPPKPDYRGFFRAVRKNRNFRSLMLQQFLGGLSYQGVMSLLVSVLIFQAVGNELSFGGWSSVFSAICIITMFLFAKLFKKKVQKPTQLFATMIIVVCCVPLLLEVNFINILIYNFGFYTAVRIMREIIYTDVIMFSKIKPYDDKYNVEFFAVREILLNTGRALGYVALAFTALPAFGLAGGLKLVFIIVIAAIMLMGLLSANFRVYRRK